MSWYRTLLNRLYQFGYDTAVEQELWGAMRFFQRRMRGLVDR